MGQAEEYRNFMFELLRDHLLGNEVHNNSQKDDAVEGLRRHVELVAEFTQMPERGISYSEDLPAGYLNKTLGDWWMAIPWPLAEWLPDDATLAEFCDLSDLAKVGDSSTFCLSGTSARTSLHIEVGDIDFCEYIFDEPARVKNNVIARLRDPASDCIPVEVKLFASGDNEKVSILCPWPLQLEANSDHEKFLTSCGVRQFKIDYLGYTARYQYLPVTNMVLPGSPGESKQGEQKKSYSFQEVVMSKLPRNEGALWPLLSMREMIGYIAFLLRDARDHLPLNPLKALKRSSALIWMLEIHEFDHELVTLFGRLDVSGATKRARILEAVALAERYNVMDCAIEKVRQVIELVKAGDVKLVDEHIPSEFEERCYVDCRDLAKRMLAMINNQARAFDSLLADRLQSAFGVTA